MRVTHRVTRCVMFVCSAAHDSSQGRIQGSRRACRTYLRLNPPSARPAGGTQHHVWLLRGDPKGGPFGLLQRRAEAIARPGTYGKSGSDEILRSGLSEVHVNTLRRWYVRMSRECLNQGGRAGGHVRQGSMSACNARQQQRNHKRLHHGKRPHLQELHVAWSRDLRSGQVSKPRL